MRLRKLPAWNQMRILLNHPELAAEVVKRARGAIAAQKNP